MSQARQQSGGAVVGGNDDPDRSSSQCLLIPVCRLRLSARYQPEVLRNRKMSTDLILMVRDAKLGGKILSDRANSKG